MSANFSTSSEDDLEALRQSEEKILTQEKRQLFQSAEETTESWESIKARRGQEFAVLPKDLPSSSGLSRRDFLQYMGAFSALLTTTACTRRPVDTLVPYVNKPQGFVYGVPVWYASSSPEGYGILVKTREGRPIKLEGNPDHPVNEGGLDASTQASLLDLYNPERLKGPLVGGSTKPATWQEIDDAVAKALAVASPGAVRILSGPVVSPTLRSQLFAFSSKYKSKLHTTTDFPMDPVLEAHSVLTGKRIFPTLRFDKADVVVSFDADFLGTWVRPLEFTKMFSKRRKIHRGDTSVNRLFSFESLLTLTGIAADHRFALSPSHQLPVLMALAATLSDSGLKLDANFKSTFVGFNATDALKDSGVSLSDLKMVAEALLSAKGRSLLVAGGNTAAALEVQYVALMLNQALQNFGQTIDYDQALITGLEDGEDAGSLLTDLNEGRVDVLIIHGVNPLYAFPNSDEWEKAFAKAKLVLTLSTEVTETGLKSHYVLAESHFLESWGDTEIREGVRSIQQPAIEPLYHTRSFGEVLQIWSGDTSGDYRSLVQAEWKKYSTLPLHFETQWNEQLKTGATSKKLAKRAMTFKWTAPSKAIQAALGARSVNDLEVVLYRHNHLGDGSFANNAWLQELPDPISKVTWGNYVAISPSLAQHRGIKLNDVVSVTAGNASLQLPAFIQPGLPGNVVAIAVGYGRLSAGSVGTQVGVNAYGLSAQNASTRQFRGLKANINKTGKTEILASTQKHFELQGRDEDILQQMTLADFLKDPKSAKKKETETFSLYNEKEFVYPSHRWGMAIDLNTCTGCQACVVACYSENNISVVGKSQVDHGRHMAWLRLDLYYTSSQNETGATFEPMLCQQCSKAPCETVCPVLATVHSDDGLNDMTYNRCVGTRYCANNCPYKVRRFNYFQYSDSLAGKIDVVDPLPMRINPDVTVRTRGVMEKCTFCVQRIRRGVDEARDAKEPVVDGSIQTACQQSCPTNAIVFGDLNDKNSEVSKLSELASSFKVLEILNTRPAISYLPRIRNRGTQA